MDAKEITTDELEAFVVKRLMDEHKAYVKRLMDEHKAFMKRLIALAATSPMVPDCGSSACGWGASPVIIDEAAFIGLNDQVRVTKTVSDKSEGRGYGARMVFLDEHDYHEGEQGDQQHPIVRALYNRK